MNPASSPTHHPNTLQARGGGAGKSENPAQLEPMGQNAFCQMLYNQSEHHGHQPGFAAWQTGAVKGELITGFALPNREALAPLSPIPPHSNYLLLLRLRLYYYYSSSYYYYYDYYYYYSYYCLLTTNY